jgi:predicted ATPase
MVDRNGPLTKVRQAWQGLGRRHLSAGYLRQHDDARALILRHTRDVMLRETMRGWRFYDHFAPMPAPGACAPDRHSHAVLSHDGSDLARPADDSTDRRNGVLDAADR